MLTGLTEALIRLNEDELTRRFIIPLIERVHPGTIEFTHSPLEAPDTILLLDGLDESEFDMAAHVERDRTAFKRVVVSLPYGLRNVVAQEVLNPLAKSGLLIVPIT